MGRYYAAQANEPDAVAVAVEQHYWPRHAGDRLPEQRVGCAVALADRIDTLLGIFAIGERPTGVKDPYGLRRAAIGVLRIMIETPLRLDLRQLLEEAARGYEGIVDAGASVDEVFDYCIERLKRYYAEAPPERRAGPDVIASVLALEIAEPLDIDRRIRAVQRFRELPAAAALAAANKRTRNILRKAPADAVGAAIDATLLQDPNEQALVEQLDALAEHLRPLLEQRDYDAVLSELASLRSALDAFFDQVMVMAEDARVRANRLAILRRTEQLFLNVADLSLLQE
jgi:glycyl-tRNA synthetase beta chain